MFIIFPPTPSDLPPPPHSGRRKPFVRPDSPGTHVTSRVVLTRTGQTCCRSSGFIDHDSGPPSLPLIHHGLSAIPGLVDPEVTGNPLPSETSQNVPSHCTRPNLKGPS